jgi:hypothetical protein
MGQSSSRDQAGYLARQMLLEVRCELPEARATWPYSQADPTVGWVAAVACFIYQSAASQA